MESLSERDFLRRSLEAGDAPADESRKWTNRATGAINLVPNGMDPGWDYTPGRSWVESQTPPPIEGGELLQPPAAIVQWAASDTLPVARSAPASRILPSDLSDNEYTNRFLGEFGISGGQRDTIFRDAVDEPIIISDQLFIDRKGQSKLRMRGRERFLLLLADTIRSPDEIWVAGGAVPGKSALRRRYVAQWAVDGQDAPGLAVFEAGPEGWVGVTAFSPDLITRPNYLDHRIRLGQRVYRREG